MSEPSRSVEKRNLHILPGSSLATMTDAQIAAEIGRHGSEILRLQIELGARAVSRSPFAMFLQFKVRL